MKTETKNRDLWFALGWIAAYVVVMSAAENLGSATGSPQGVRLMAACPLLVIVYFAGGRRGGLGRYGFAPMNGLPWKKLLYMLPLAVIATANLWWGVTMRFSARETLCSLAAMACIGFLEELLFRGFLLGALLPAGERSAILITGLTFGLGHIVNLFNGAEVLSTLLQLGYAMAIGLLLSVFAVRAGNLVPCCIFHAVFNMLSAFAGPAAGEMLPQVVTTIAIVTLSLGYAGYLWNCVTARGERTDLF